MDLVNFGGCGGGGPKVAVIWRSTHQKTRQKAKDYQGQPVLHCQVSCCSAGQTHQFLRKCSKSLGWNEGPWCGLPLSGSCSFLRFFPLRCSGRVRPWQGTEICNFGALSPLEALHWSFCFFSSIYVRFSKTSPLKSGESSETSSGENRVKSLSRLWLSWFFRPWTVIATTNLKRFLVNWGVANGSAVPQFIVPLAEQT